MSVDTTEQPEVGGLAPWFGCKRGFAHHIVPEIGPHNAWWDVFCGSMAVTMAKPKCRMESVIDLHGDLTNLAKIIRDPKLGPKLYRRLRRTLYCEDLYHQSRLYIRELQFEEGLDRAYNYFVMSWMGINGLSGIVRRHDGMAKRYTVGGGQGAKRFDSAVQSIAQWRERIRYVNIFRGDAFDILAKIDDQAGTVIYVDPPYLVKGAKYLHDFTWEDHVRLAKALSRFKFARVIVSYYDDPLLDELYPGWTKRTFDVAKNMTSVAKTEEKRTRAPEVLLINGPSYVTTAQKELFA